MIPNEKIVFLCSVFHLRSSNDGDVPFSISIQTRLKKMKWCINIRDLFNFYLNQIKRTKLSRYWSNVEYFREIELLVWVFFSTFPQVISCSVIFIFYIVQYAAILQINLPKILKYPNSIYIYAYSVKFLSCNGCKMIFDQLATNYVQYDNYSR